MQTLIKGMFAAIIILSSTVMYTCATAQVGPFENNQVIGFYEDGESITFGEYFDDVKDKQPQIIDYCRMKANMGMAIMNERNTKSEKEIFAELEMTSKTPREQYYMYVDTVRMANDALRKNQKGKFIIAGNTEDEIMKFVDSEFHACVIYRY